MRRLSLIYGNYRSRGIAEAPADGKQYARKDGAWSEVEAGGGVTLEELMGAVKNGNLYNHFAVVDIRKITSSDEWDIPEQSHWENMLTAIGATQSFPVTTWSAGANKLKDIGTEFWNDANGTDDYGLSLRGSGIRSTAFGDLKTQFHTAFKTEYDADNVRQLYIHSAADYIKYNAYTSKSTGLAYRLVRNATTEELLLSDGIYVDDYIGNNSRRYKAVKIGSYVWLAEPLMEDKYRNGDAISGPTFTNVEWDALTTEAYCIYDNDKTNAGTTGELQHNLLAGIDGDGTIHISEAEKQKIADAITDAPSDGNEYVRKDGAWVAGGGGASAPGTITSTSTNTDTGTEHTHELDELHASNKSVTFASLTIDKKGRVTVANSGSTSGFVTKIASVYTITAGAAARTLAMGFFDIYDSIQQAIVYISYRNTTTNAVTQAVFQFTHDSGASPTFLYTRISPADTEVSSDIVVVNNQYYVRFPAGGGNHPDNCRYTITINKV